MAPVLGLEKDLFPQLHFHAMVLGSASFYGETAPLVESQTVVFLQHDDLALVTRIFFSYDATDP